jgi:hypothetical protein
MERLAALIPRPRANFVRYHVVFAANSKWRSAVVGVREEAAATEGKPPSGKRHWIALKETVLLQGAPRALEQHCSQLWSDLLRRVFELDVLKCPDCGGRCRILGVIEADHQPDVVVKILAVLRGRRVTDDLHLKLCDVWPSSLTPSPPWLRIPVRTHDHSLRGKGHLRLSFILASDLPLFHTLRCPFIVFTLHA